MNFYGTLKKKAGEKIVSFFVKEVGEWIHKLC